MSSAPLADEFWSWLDEQPCTATGMLVQTGRGETRVVPREVALSEWRARHQQQQRRRRDPGIERRRNELKLLGVLLEREERTDHER